jgi:hypothetical protein
MNAWWNTLSLLALRDPRLDGIASGFRQRQHTTDSRTVILVLMIFTVLIVVFWLVARFAERFEQRRASNSPWGLFFSLARAHRLKWSETWFLWRLARRQRLNDPARIFLEPDRLQPPQAGVSPKLLESLQERLFVDLGEAPSLAKEPAGDLSQAEGEPSIPLFPTVQSPQLDLPPWNTTSVQ